MPNALSTQLREYREKRHLISVHRSAVEQQGIFGFILDYSADLLLLQAVEDFRLDGLRLIRRTDITRLECRDPHHFRRALLDSVGLIETIDFDSRHHIDSFRNFLETRQPGEIVILEDEHTRPKHFVIGAITEINAETVYITYVTGNGQFMDPARPVPIPRITSCRAGMDHITFYKRHRSRTREE